MSEEGRCPLAADKISEIRIRFSGPGAADATMSVEAVTPGQIFLASKLLDFAASEVRAQQVMAAASDEAAISEVKRKLAIAGKH